MRSFLTFTVSQQSNKSVIVISFYSIVSQWIKLKFGVKLKPISICSSKQLFFIIYYKQDNFYSVFGRFLAKYMLEIG